MPVKKEAKGTEDKKALGGSPESPKANPEHLFKFGASSDAHHTNLAKVGVLVGASIDDLTSVDQPSPAVVADDDESGAFMSFQREGEAHPHDHPHRRRGSVEYINVQKNMEERVRKARYSADYDAAELRFESSVALCAEKTLRKKDERDLIKMAECGKLKGREVEMKEKEYVRHQESGDFDEYLEKQYGIQTSHDNLDPAGITTKQRRASMLAIGAQGRRNSAGSLAVQRRNSAIGLGGGGAGVMGRQRVGSEQLA
ncbi:unnamed protein product [Vitrella brassicaformis CCMP3155]|uniref:Uncharacterized protein n=2 Tax=Vitrella brassicaformis TaxID=1169539 RepID=A0A0G4FEX1_VITBC|nr:unnamed protein product [Vitrella brassicaformis CCMP3155]|mmetsp:Transcript_1435/g.3118  ORF Transcript_1435/g.3118 Transcript_1435/m.3118 type:complete len:256 (+) Transcript_1435:62-829(+)|eukprot:CEM11790.1 unnamed protein product [Vitrella brassicaformis CCMP3155]